MHSQEICFSKLTVHSYKAIKIFYVMDRLTFLLATLTIFLLTASALPPRCYQT